MVLDAPPRTRSEGRGEFFRSGLGPCQVVQRAADAVAVDRHIDNFAPLGAIAIVHHRERVCGNSELDAEGSEVAEAVIRPRTRFTPL